MRGDTRDEEELVGEENDRKDVGPGRRLLAPLAVLLVRRRGFTTLGVGVGPDVVELGLSMKNDLECGEDPNGSDLSWSSSLSELQSSSSSPLAPLFGRANSSSILNGDGLSPFPALTTSSCAGGPATSTDALLAIFIPNSAGLNAARLIIDLAVDKRQLAMDSPASTSYWWG